MRKEPLVVRTNRTADDRDSGASAKGAGRNLAEYAYGAEICPWAEEHSDPRAALQFVNNINEGTAVVRTRTPGGVRAGGG